MRVALINDGMYPFRAGVGGTWAHRLVRGMPEHAFHLVTITDRQPAVRAFDPPTNTLTTNSITLDGPALGPTRRRAALRHRRVATHAAVLMCRSMLEDTPSSLVAFRAALRMLASGASENVHPLHGVPLAAVLLDAWSASATARRESPPALASAVMPMPTPDDAWNAADLIERALRPLSTPLPLTELNHATDAGLSALVAIGAKWRTHTPYVVTEHETYLDAPLLAHTYGRPGVRAVLLRFFRALARLAYHEAGVVAPPTEHLRRWALDHGADLDRLVLTPYGVDPYGCALLRGEPADPTVVWLGPDRDLDTMLAALPALHAAQPTVRVLVAGPTVRLPDPSQEEVIGFLGPVSHRRSAYAIGQVVVLSSDQASMPYALIEAMMCGRPTIVMDNGALADTVGMGAMIVPPDAPDALATAIITLLADPARRRQMSVAAGARARNLFALRAKLDRFREVYERASRDTSAATEPIMPAPTPSRDSVTETIATPEGRHAVQHGAEQTVQPTRKPAPRHTAGRAAPRHAAAEPATRHAVRPAALSSLAAKLLAPLPPEPAEAAGEATRGQAVPDEAAADASAAT